jgi:hypothetical protein
MTLVFIELPDEDMALVLGDNQNQSAATEL